MSRTERKSSLLGALAGAFLPLFAKKKQPTGPDDLRKTEFKTSTQRLGVRFTERIRRVFRFKWLRRT